jgi:hypothetical protein
MDSLTLPELASALTAIAMLSITMLRGWSGWLALKHRELDAVTKADQPAQPSATQRIEMADLKERLRKLEAIAAGVDL